MGGFGPLQTMFDQVPFGDLAPLKTQITTRHGRYRARAVQATAACASAQKNSCRAEALSDSTGAAVVLDESNAAWARKNVRS